MMDLILPDSQWISWVILASGCLFLILAILETYKTVQRYVIHPDYSPLNTHPEYIHHEDSNTTIAYLSHRTCDSDVNGNLDRSQDTIQGLEVKCHIMMRCLALFSVILSVITAVQIYLQCFEKINKPVSLDFVINGIWLLSTILFSANIALISTHRQRACEFSSYSYTTLFLMSLILLDGWKLFKDNYASILTNQVFYHAVTSILILILVTIYSWCQSHLLDEKQYTQQMNNIVSNEETSSFMSRITFSWLNTLIRLGLKRPLTDKDLWKLRVMDESESCMKRFQERKCSSLFWSLLSTVKGLVIYQAFCALADLVFQVGRPFCMNKILLWFQTQQNSTESTLTSLSTPLTYILLLFACNVCKAITDAQQYFTGRRVSLHIRSILVNEIYCKSLLRPLCVSGDDGNDSSVGQIVTLMSVDTERIREYLAYSHRFLLQTPLSLLLALSGFVYIMGSSAIAGIGVILLSLPLTTWIGRRLTRVQENVMKGTDERVGVTNEVLNGIRIIKYFAWEPQFISKISVTRQKELTSLIHLWIHYIAFSTVSYTTGLLVCFTTFAVRSLVYKLPLDSATVFTGLILVKWIMDILAYLPYEFVGLVQGWVGFNRIQSFLEKEEVDKEHIVTDPQSYTIGDEVHVCKNADFRYFAEGGDSESVFTLKGLNVGLKVGGLNVVCGSTGAGKSALCLALIGEMKQLSGIKSLRGAINGCPVIGYAAQSSWLLNATIKDNILMGLEFDAERYAQVLYACALTRDLDALEGGDLTEIGEKGVNVSGGQKQRISLARTLYSKSPILILDDPLSAVDAPTARHLLHNALLGPLSANRTLVLVSHAVSLVLPVADTVTIMSNGTILASGPPNEVLSHPDAKNIIDDWSGERGSPSISQESLVVPSAPRPVTSKVSKLVKVEEQATGSVRFEVYWGYISAAGGLFFICGYVLCVWIVLGMQFAFDFWLKRWSEVSMNGSLKARDAVNHHSVTWIEILTAGPRLAVEATKIFGGIGTIGNNSNHSDVEFSIMGLGGNDEKMDMSYYVVVYGLLGLSCVLATNFSSLVQIMGAYKASTVIHTRLIEAILGAPLRFFEITPIGRVLNRFSKDMTSVDQEVMRSISFFINRISMCISIIIVISFGYWPFLISVSPIVFISYNISKLYLNTSREIKRLESTTRSPIYAQFSESLAGVSTIRAYFQSNRFIKQNQLKVDTNHRAYYLLWAVNRWLCFRTDVISAVVVLLAGLTVILGKNISPGWAGLILLYASQFSDALLWVVRTHADMEMSLNSVERCIEYSEVEQEPAGIVEDYRPPEGWPSEGCIEVKNLSVRYAPDQPFVLKSVNFWTRPGEKIGVVGRTGAGKSTLSLAFFRIIPLSEGQIIIDGMDINKMGLKDLRSRLTIIPQDPVLFTGTIRSNLDPHSHHSDSEIWSSLKSTRIFDSIPEATLETPVSENGQNFSQGQRQLLCLARALLRQSRVVCLDEATASIDAATDARIQETIREYLVDSTVFCIAHRLRTVVDYDRILVLSHGQVEEFGTPLELLKMRNCGTDSKVTGHFYNMCKETGEFDELVQIAQGK